MKFGVDSLHIAGKMKHLFNKKNLFAMLILFLKIILINNNNRINEANKGFLDNFVGKFEEGLNNLNKLGNFMNELKQLNQVLAKDSYAKITNDLKALKPSVNEEYLPSNQKSSENMKYLIKPAIKEIKINKNFNKEKSQEDKTHNGFKIIEIGETFKVSKRTSKAENSNNEVGLINQTSALNIK